MVLSLAALKIFDKVFNASSVLLPILLIGELKWLFFNESINSSAATIALSVDDLPGIGIFCGKSSMISKILSPPVLEVYTM